MPSETIPDDATHIKGPNFDNAINLQDLLESYEKIGFQATGMAKAIQIVEQMVSPHLCDAGSLSILLSNRLVHTRYHSVKPERIPTNPYDCSSGTHPT